MEPPAGEWQSNCPPQGERLQSWAGHAFALLTRDNDVT